MSWMSRNESSKIFYDHSSIEKGIVLDSEGGIDTSSNEMTPLRSLKHGNKMLNQEM